MTFNQTLKAMKQTGNNPDDCIVAYHVPKRGPVRKVEVWKLEYYHGCWRLGSAADDSIPISELYLHRDDIPKKVGKR